MKRFIVLIIFSQLLLSQYVLGKGLYLGANSAFSFVNINETEISSDQTTRYSGSGSAFGVEALYKFDRRNMLLLEFGQRKLEIRHNSSLLVDSNRIANSSIKQKMQSNSFQIQYLKKFEQNPLFIGGGAGGRFPLKNTSDDYLQDVLEQSYGIGTIGLEFANHNYSIVTYLTYAFPVSKLKKNDQFTAQMGELFIGLKLWVKLF